jgi:hypothetical protein
MSDDTILGWLWAVDFGQAMSSLVLSLAKSLADSSQVQAKTKLVCR